METPSKPGLASFSVRVDKDHHIESYIAGIHNYYLADKISQQHFPTNVIKTNGAGPLSFKVFITLAYLHRTGELSYNHLCSIDGSAKTNPGGSMASAFKKDAKWLLGYFGYRKVRPGEKAPQKKLINDLANSIVVDMFNVDSKKANQFETRLSPVFPQLNFISSTDWDDPSLPTIEIDNHTYCLLPTAVVAKSALNTIEAFRVTKPDWQPTELIKTLEKIATKKIRAVSPIPNTTKSAQVKSLKSNFPLEITLLDGTPLDGSKFEPDYTESYTFPNGKTFWHGINKQTFFTNLSDHDTGQVMHIYKIDKRMQAPEGFLELSHPVFGSQLETGIGADADPQMGGVIGSSKRQLTIGFFMGEARSKPKPGNYIIELIIRSMDGRTLYRGQFDVIFRS